MSVSFVQPVMKTFTAGEDLSAKQYTFVKFGSNNESIVGCSVADEKSIGILMNAPASGELAEVALPGGGAKLKARGVIARGAYISTTNAGQGKAAAVLDGAVAHVGAMAHMTSATNDIIEVLVISAPLSKPAA